MKKKEKDKSKQQKRISPTFLPRHYGEYKIIKYDILCTETQDRYVIIDKYTYQMLDNANGYGYKTWHDALNCYKYKLRHCRWA